MNGRTNEVNHKMTAFLFEWNSGSKRKQQEKMCPLSLPISCWLYERRANARHRWIVKSGAANKMTRNECGHREWRRFENTIDNDDDNHHHHLDQHHHSVAFVDCVCNYDLYFKQTKAHHLVPYQNKQCSCTRAHAHSWVYFVYSFVIICGNVQVIKPNTSATHKNERKRETKI